ncbi:hypothetical protein ACROYT_G024616 [Oculina patagonica]
MWIKTHGILVKEDSPKVVSPDAVVRSLPGYGLSCKATGTPPVYTAIIMNSSVLVNTTKTAKIILNYEGNYTCVATSKYGTDAREVSVIFTDCRALCADIIMKITFLARM